ncbi:MAG: hypothetical protein ABIQ70_03460 [Dokdonella sp.]
MISIARLGWPLLFFFAISGSSHAWSQEKIAQTSDITVTGKVVTTEDLKNSEKTMSFPKSEIMAFMKTGKPACEHGTTLANFEAAKGLYIAGEDLTGEELIKRIIALKEANKTSCLVIVAATYDKPTFDALDKALVVPQQISLMWNAPDQSK